MVDFGFMDILNYKPFHCSVRAVNLVDCRELESASVLLIVSFLTAG